MHEALTGLADTADLALSAVRAVIGEEGLEPTARLIADARTRLDYPEDVVVAALIGGTGSGKSSLFNAIVGYEATPVGELRPTTSEPMAAVPERLPDALDDYLDTMGVTTRVVHSAPHLCLIDLPDTDSVVLQHRHRVEVVLPRIDVAVWVVDPEKYRDAALHMRYLRPLAEYSRQFVFVLNQVDRLAPSDLEAVTADLREALAEDGISEPTIVTTAVPPDVPPTGVGDLIDALRHLGARRETLYGKLVSDFGRAANDMERMVGRPLGYRDLLAQTVDEAAGLVLASDRHQATAALGRFCDDIAARVGGQPEGEIRAFAASIPSMVDAAVAELVPRRRASRWSRAEPDDTMRIGEARRRIEVMLAPVTGLVTARARALALVAELAVGAARLELLARGAQGRAIVAG